MSISSIVPPSVISNQQSLPGSARIPTQVLGQNDFLKLVVAQLANQDPTKPQTDTEFIAQMTQFTALEQTKSMGAEIAQMRQQQQLLQAMSLLDREVIVKTDHGPATGVVTGFDVEKDQPKLIIGDKRYDLKDILTIRLPIQN